MTHHSFWYVSPHQWPIVTILAVALAVLVPIAYRRAQARREYERWYADYVRRLTYVPDQEDGR
jgi:hypothetical protein